MSEEVPFISAIIWHSVCAVGTCLSDEIGDRKSRDAHVLASHDQSPRRIAGEIMTLVRLVRCAMDRLAESLVCCAQLPHVSDARFVSN
jgi:hypothetical protein